MRTICVSFPSLLHIFLSVQSVVSLWPIPQSISNGQDILLLSRDFKITSGLSVMPQDLSEAIERSKARLFADRLGRLLVGRGSNDSISFGSARTLQSLQLSLSDGSNSVVRNVSEEAVASLETRNETYTLMVPSDGQNATIVAPTTLGLLRGLTTFEQLWYTFSEQVYAINMPLNVEDGPAYVCSP